jgi:membrane-bound ClpP family serine protease
VLNRCAKVGLLAHLIAVVIRVAANPGWLHIQRQVNGRDLLPVSAVNESQPAAFVSCLGQYWRAVSDRKLLNGSITRNGAS